MEEVASSLEAVATEIPTKRRKAVGDERSHRKYVKLDLSLLIDYYEGCVQFDSRERNKMHARKTRERKKIQTIALQKRVKELKEEGARLRMLVDETYIAGSLLGLKDSMVENSGKVPVKTSASICRNFYELQCADQLLQDGSTDCLEEAVKVPTKRIRRTGRYDPQERDKIRFVI
jgi:hypothetical protein